jgi:cell wall-associated NlpC family hydrolase
VEPARPERVRAGQRAPQSEVPAPRRSRPGRIRNRVIAVAGTFFALSLVLPAGVGQAKPGPSVKELKAQAQKLSSQLEQLSEQVNGLKVRYQQSQRAAKVAADNARRQEVALQTVQQKVGRLAADSYMAGGMDQTVALATAQDPQAMLDQAATLHYFASQDGTEVQTLVQAMQAAQRARKSAQDRATQTQSLKSQIDRDKKKVQSLYDKVRSKLIDKAPGSIASLPVSGSGKGAQALRYAMSKLGRPYVWGAAGPTTFDCSGLTMWAYGQIGINLPHYTGSQWNAGTHISRSQLQPGDLVFFYSDLHHMGMYIGGGQMIHAPQTGDVVKISPMGNRPFAGGVRVA